MEYSSVQIRIFYTCLNVINGLFKYGLPKNGKFIFEVTFSKELINYNKLNLDNELLTYLKFKFNFNSDRTKLIGYCRTSIYNDRSSKSRASDYLFTSEISLGLSQY